MIGALIRGLMNTSTWAYFRHIDVVGMENVPPDGPLILASNHVNALVDPTLIQLIMPRPITGTAKASLMKNPYLSFILRSVGVLEFHRPTESDARAAAKANRMAIEQCRDHLAGGAALCIFPEGKSHSGPGMLPFKKGLARIAIDFPGPLAIVPVGLFYERKERFRSRVSVRFGPPIDPREYGRDGNALTRDVRSRIAALTVQFRRSRDTVLLEWVAQLLEAREPPAALRDDPPVTDHAQRLQRVVARHGELADAGDERIDDLERRVRAHRKELLGLGVTPTEVRLPLGLGRALHFLLCEAEILIVGGAIASLGWINNILPFLVVRTVARRISRERDQWASNSIYPAMLVYPVFYLLQIALSWALLPVPWAIAYTLMLPLSSAYYLPWRDRIRGAWRRARTFLRWRRNRGVQARLAEEGRRITEDILALAGDES